jgi:hypothetical protein
MELRRRTEVNEYRGFLSYIMRKGVSGGTTERFRADGVVLDGVSAILP